MESPYAYIYSVVAYWGPRAENLDEICSRYLRMLDELAKINPVFGNWFFLGRERATLLELLSRDEIVTLIENGVCRGDDGAPAPKRGYMFGAANGPLEAPGHDPRHISISVHAGNASAANYFINTVRIRTDVFNDSNATFINLDVFKATILAVAQAWGVTWCSAFPWGLLDFRRQRNPPRPSFDLAWICYVSPRFAPMVTPPRSGIVERAPDGGLVMIATEQRFDFGNPAHLAAAREIEASLAAVNALPWPLDR